MTAPLFWEWGYNGGCDLFYPLTRCAYFDKDICFEEDGVAEISARIEVKHRYVNASTSGGTWTHYPIGVAMRIHRRFATTQAGLATASSTYIPRAYSAGNITGDGHYYALTLPSFPVFVQAGWTRWEVHLTAHTDAGSMNGQDGAATLNRKTTADSDYNFVAVTFHPGATIQT